MSNYCYYSMRVKGYKRNVDEFIKIIKYGYYNDKTNKAFGPHMFRVFDAEICDEQIIGIEKTVSISGYCAWSVNCCMMDGSFSYYDENFKNGYKYGTNLIKESKRLNLFIEVCSEELGMGFGEYIRIDSGILCSNECYEAYNIYANEYESVDDMNGYIEYINKEYNTYYPLISEKEFNRLLEDPDEPYAYINKAFDLYDSSNDDVMCLNIMCELEEK